MTATIAAVHINAVAIMETRNVWNLVKAVEKDVAETIISAVPGSNAVVESAVCPAPVRKIAVVRKRTAAGGSSAARKTERSVA